MSFHTPYRWCVVPNCNNTSLKTPEKLFIKVPDDIKMRNVWLELAGRDPNKLSTKSLLHLCEDHFDLEQQMENYMQYKIMGSVKKVRMKPKIVPSKLNLKASVTASQAAESSSACLHPNSPTVCVSDLQDVSHNEQKADKEVQVKIMPRMEYKAVQVKLCARYRSKATQIRLKLRDSTTSPIKMNMSVDTSTCGCGRLRAHDIPRTFMARPVKRKLAVLEDSDYIPSIAGSSQDISPKVEVHRLEHNYTRKEHLDHTYYRRGNGNKDDTAPAPRPEAKRLKVEPEQPSFYATGLKFIPIKPKPSDAELTGIVDEPDHLVGSCAYPESTSPSHSDVPEPEPDPGPFSWQKSIPISIEKDDLLTHDSDKKVNLEDGEEYKSNDLNPVTNFPSKDNQDEDEGKYVSEKHADFSCDHCLGDIIGFRYSCVQCENFDLCRACEGALVHAHHYMLRVPRPRPFNEIRSVIAAIRVKLKILEGSFKQQSDDWSDVVIKKEEDPLEMEETAVPQAESVQDPFGESIVPNADPEISQAAEQERGATLNMNNSIRNSVTGILEGEVYLQQDNADSDVIFLQQDTGIPDTESDVVFVQDSSNNDLIFLHQNTSSNTDVVFLQDVSDDIVLEEVATDSTTVVVLQNNASASSNNVTFLKQQTSDANIEIPQDSISNADVEQCTAVATPNEMFEEYLDEIWLKKSAVVQGNKKESEATTTNVIK